MGKEKDLKDGHGQQAVGLGSGSEGVIGDVIEIIGLFEEVANNISTVQDDQVGVMPQVDEKGKQQEVVSGQEKMEEKAGVGKASEALEGQKNQIAKPYKVTANILSLPTEILEMIFEYFVDHDELRRLAEVCHQFHDAKISVCSRSKRTWLFDSVLPPLYPYLNRKDILNCRQVCKRWKNGVDKLFLREAPDRDRNIIKFSKSRSCGSAQYKPSLYQKGLLGKNLETSFSLSQYISNITACPTANAFLLGSASFGPGTWDTEYWRQVARLLETHGPLLLHLTLNVNIGVDPSKYRREYNILWRCLSLTPNLKTLTVSGFLFNNNLLLQPGNIDRDPLPTLSKLEIMTIKDLQSPLIAQKLLMAYSNQIKKLTNLSVDEPTYGIPLHWPEIIELRMIVSRRSDMVGYLFFRQFIAPHLKKLSVISYERFHITRFLYSLKGLDSIEILNIHSFFGFEVSFGMLNDIFVLPRVKKLEIKDMLEIPYELLFTHLPNVEELLVYLDWRHVSPREPWIQVHHFEVYNTNNWMRANNGMSVGTWQWQKMPKLKRIVFAFMSEEEDMKLTVFTTFNRPESA